MGWNFKEDTYKGMNDFTLQLEYGFIDNSYVYTSTTSGGNKHTTNIDLTTVSAKLPTTESQSSVTQTSQLRMSTAR
jgi:hypothetical protein